MTNCKSKATPLINHTGEVHATTYGYNTPAPGGPLLVAVNPYSDIEGLYTEEMLDKYLAIMPSDGAPEPHVFGMAARAYQKMMASGENQAVVISGESGAGKTETAKLLLQFLAVAASGTSSQQDDSRGALQRAVMGSNPIMESFG